MRHQVKGRKLKRTHSHRNALLKNLAASLFLHKRIETTIAKAKELRSFAEPLITRARKGTLHDMRIVMSALRHKEAAKELFNNVVPAVGDRKGGYTRIVRTAVRLGDAAQMAIIELVDYNEAANQMAQQRQEAREAAAATKKEKEAEKASAES
ncbi:MAG: 50S ribosomal protein L17 [Ignavibacteria bacterium]|nr:50S ribosomal protein L17 [Ignavibacteria bacterium]MCA0389222.1 50S ribosomal protein L17 [Bacteroidota bacterium]